MLTLQQVLNHRDVKGKSPLVKVLAIQQLWLDKRLELPQEWVRVFSNLPVPDAKQKRALGEVGQSLRETGKALSLGANSPGVR